MNLLRKLMLNVSVVITFFKTLHSWKMLLKQRWMFDEITGEKKVCIKGKSYNSICNVLIFENLRLLSRGQMFEICRVSKGYSFSVLEMVSFSNTVNYLATQMNNETSYKKTQQRKIYYSSKCNWVRVSLLVSPVSMLVVEFVGRVCEASNSVFFSEWVPSGIRSSGCETGLSGLLARVLSSRPLTTKRTRKNSSRREEGINALCLVIGQLVAESLGGGIDSREEIDL